MLLARMVMRRLALRVRACWDLQCLWHCARVCEGDVVQAPKCTLEQLSEQPGKLELRSGEVLKLK